MSKNGTTDFTFGGKGVAMSNVDTISEATKKEAIRAFNEANKKAEDAYRANIDAQIAKSNEAKKKAEELEIMPVGPYIMFKLYTENPYEQILQTDSGLILPAFDGKELSRETGQMEKDQKAVEIGHVIEVGPEVVNIQPGDDIMLRAGMMLPVPFLRQGFWVTGQNNVLVVINKGLTKRFEEYKLSKQEGEWVDLSKIPGGLGKTLDERINKWLEYKKKGVMIVNSN